MLSYGINQFQAVRHYMAEHFNFSVSYYSRLIKSSTGVNFNDWKRTFCLQRAEHLLLSSNYTISQISNTVGYANPESFINSPWLPSTSISVPAAFIGCVSFIFTVFCRDSSAISTSGISSMSKMHRSHLGFGHLTLSTEPTSPH